MEEKNMQEKKTVSRRSFLQGASVAALGAASLGLGACGPSESAGSTSSGAAASPASGEAVSDIWTISALPEPAETVQADVAIVGGGGTGTAAAIQSKQLGLEPLVVDCGNDFGGSFIGTEGMFGVETHWTKEAGETLTVSKAVDQCLIYHHWIPNHELYMNFFGQTGETVEWVEALGVHYADVVSLGISDVAWHVYARTDKSSPGHTFMEGLGKAAHDLGINAEFGAFARKIVMEDGKVAGLLVERRDGSILKIEAPVVVLGSGGYSTNEAMIYELSNSANENIFSVGAETRNGDGLIMAKDAGAAFAESPGTVMWCGPWIIGAGWGSDGYCSSVQPTLWINENAERFCNEDLWLDDFAAAGMAIRNQKRTYVLFGEKDIDRFVNEGPYGPVFTFGQVGVPMVNARTELEGLPTVH
ncbi:MAG: FAD-binding protein, partial [Coriobacteriales bacterium]|nr:FAD-binding protein [Coriobacteriales bacterium]